LRSRPLNKEILVSYTPEFKRNLRALSKKYRHIQEDLQPVLDQLQLGNFIGDRIPGIQFTLFKLRVKNSDIQKGKSSGYRLIYRIFSPSQVVLLTLYSKLDQGDVSVAEIKRIIKTIEN
jgi:mRNA-degrading endonuclease RelE of RelBE toxin-antitoxin system